MTRFLPRLTTRAFVCGSLVLCAFGARAQEPQPPAQLTVKVELVNVAVSVTDAGGNHLRGLDRNHFRILDNGREQPITSFVSVDAPALVFLLVEAGPAVYLIQRQYLTSAHILFQTLAEDDWVGVAGYDAAPSLVCPFTRDRATLQRAVEELQYKRGMGELHLFDSLSTVLDWLAEVPGKKSLVLLSTGLDTSQPQRWDALVEKLRASDVAVFAVPLGGSLREPPGRRAKDADDAAFAASSFARATEALRSIAEITGGRILFPREAKDFEKIYREIATTLRHQYILGFAPPERDGQYHRVEVLVAGARKPLAEGCTSSHTKKKAPCRITVRPGYLAPK